jgi:anti-sigma factor RsiW
MVLLRFRRRRDLACRQVVELLTDYLEGALPERDRARLEAHLAACPHCTEYLAQMRVTIAAAGHVDADELRPDLRDELVALYRRWQAD